MELVGRINTFFLEVAKGIPGVHHVWPEEVVSGTIALLLFIRKDCQDMTMWLQKSLRDLPRSEVGGMFEWDRLIA